MAARGSKKAQARTEAERARLHTARTRWHQDQIRRRTRDNAIAITVGALIVVGAIVSQVVHAQVTAPEPTPTPSPTSSIAPSPTPSDAPSPVPTASETPTE
ncbi:hypothetical protein D8M34_03375 [Microbacterium sp. HSID17254]|jgi:hypothetical protein|uniref:Dioxygenase n=1 Tax=Microbacterium paraoxydans TaxID=199592 RepID=A0ABZ2HQP1_9MICO|nr:MULTISPECIES: hypothetical protein [unclassified Microbacterium]OSO98034.1 hypothetical protein B7W94_15705 [Microbacterium sp. LEMMJ01]RUQ07871.1 hypothetical protein D8M34_03375 [Microbacterium sp. HSID17254]